MDPSSEGPERLRAVSELSEDLHGALPPMDDMLPRMTPKKADGTSEVPSPHVSRDDSVNRASLARTSFGNGNPDDMLFADMEMENIDLPPMLPPADEEVGAGANAADAKPLPDTAQENQEEVAAMDEDPPAAPDDFPVPPKDFPDAPPEDIQTEEPPANPGALFVLSIARFSVHICTLGAYQGYSAACECISAIFHAVCICRRSDE